MTLNQLLKNSVDALTVYKAFIPTDQYNKNIQPLVSEIKNYLADQSLSEIKAKAVRVEKLTGFGLFDEVLKEDFKK